MSENVTQNLVVVVSCDLVPSETCRIHRRMETPTYIVDTGDADWELKLAAQLVLSVDDLVREVKKLVG